MLNTSHTLVDPSFLTFANDPCLSTIAKSQTSSTRVILDGTFSAWLVWDAATKRYVEKAELPKAAPAKAKADGTEGTMGKAPPFKFSVLVKRLNDVEHGSGQTETRSGRDAAGYFIGARIEYAGEKWDNKDKVLKTVTLTDGKPTAKELLTFWRTRLLAGRSVPDTVRKVIECAMTEQGEFRLFHKHHIAEGSVLSASIFAYSDDTKAALNAKRPNGTPVIQPQTPVRLEGLSATIRLDPYVKGAEEASAASSASAYEAIMGDLAPDTSTAAVAAPVDPDVGNPLFGWIVSMPVSKFEFSTSKLAANVDDKTLSEQMHENYNKFATPNWVPYDMIRSERYKYPWDYTFYFYVSPQYKTLEQTPKFVRVSLTNNLSLADFEYTDKDRNKFQKYKCSLLDSILVGDKYQRYERYVVNITVGQSNYYENPLPAWGIPDVNISGRIWLATAGFPCHVLAKIGLKKMSENDHNAQRTDEQRAAMGGPMTVYEMYARTIVPDFATGLPMFGIPLSKARVIADFADAAKRVPDKRNRLYVEHIDHDDLTKTTVFRSAFGKEKNGVNDQGPDAPVINFGCGERPVLDCSDATEMLNSMDFYALCSRRDLPATDGDTAKGDLLFDALKSEPGGEFVYQIFGLRRRVVAQAEEPQRAVGAKSSRDQIETDANERPSTVVVSE